MSHALPKAPRKPHDGCPMDAQTGEIAEVIETALTEIGGDSALYRIMADHAARAVQAWMDYQAQIGELRVSIAREHSAVVELPTEALPTVQA
jgi:hypothetical protein